MRVAGEDTSVTDTFLLDIERVMRPHLSVSVTQNNAFSNFLQVMVLDTLSKTTYLSMEVQNQPVFLEMDMDMGTVMVTNTNRSFMKVMLMTAALQIRKI